MGVGRGTLQEGHLQAVTYVRLISLVTLKKVIAPQSLCRKGKLLNKEYVSLGKSFDLKWTLWHIAKRLKDMFHVEHSLLLASSAY